MNKKISLLLTALVLLSVSSCKKFLQDKDSDPNQLTSAPASTILTSSEIGFTFLHTNDWPKFTEMFAQHLEGADRQFLAINRYQITESDVNNDWLTAYSTVLMDLKQLDKTAGRDSLRHYQAIGKILTAYTLGTTTDLFGDIPYSDALNGEEGNVKPTFDSQQDIYNTIFSLLDEAIVLLNEPDAALEPGADDFIYGGDLSKWEACARVLSARYHLHLAKPLGTLASTDALAELAAGGFSSSADNFEAKAGPTIADQNNYNQFYNERAGYLVINPQFATMMSGDPRESVYFDATDPTYINMSTLAAADGNIPLVTYAEMLFIQAEASLRTGNATDAANYHNLAVAASLEQYTGSVDPGYVATYGSETSGSITLEKIMTEKYKHMFLNPESFTDVRRTGFPTLTPTDGSDIIRRFPYPLSERLYNGEHVPAGQTTDQKLWWDQ